MLIAALDSEIQARYREPLDVDLSLDAHEVAERSGCFALAWVERRAVGCGAVRLVDDDTAELKRMFVLPKFRRQGVAKTLLQFLENEAVALGATRVVLETVTAPAGAAALYRWAGYSEIPRFGPYVNSEISYCMGKRLDPGGTGTDR